MTELLQKKIRYWEDTFYLPDLVEMTEEECESVLEHLNTGIPYKLFHRNIVLATNSLVKFVAHRMPRNGIKELFAKPSKDVSGWHQCQNKPLGKKMKRKKIPYGTKFSVKLTFHERDLIRDKTFCDPDFARLAVVEGKAIKVGLSLDDIEEIQGYIAAEANHTKNKRLQKELDELFDKFQFYLDTYDDQDR